MYTKQIREIIRKPEGEIICDYAASEIQDTSRYTRGNFNYHSWRNCKYSFKQFWKQFSIKSIIRLHDLRVKADLQTEDFLIRLKSIFCVGFD